MRKALDEFIEYQKEVDGRIKNFADEVETKRIKVEELEKDFAASIIGGNKADSKPLDKAKKELDDSMHQLALIKKAQKSDEKLIKLADDVHKEYYKSKDLISVEGAKLNNEVYKLKKELEEKERQAKNHRLKATHVLKREADERMHALEYMTLTDAEKNKFVSGATGYTYNQIKERLEQAQ